MRREVRICDLPQQQADARHSPETIKSVSRCSLSCVRSLSYSYLSASIGSKLRCLHRGPHSEDQTTLALNQSAHKLQLASWVMRFSFYNSGELSRAPKLELGSYAKRSEHPQHKIGRYVLSVPIENGRDAGPRCMSESRNLLMSQRPLLYDFDYLVVQLTTNLDFEPVGGSKPK